MGTTYFFDNGGGVNDNMTEEVLSNYVKHQMWVQQKKIAQG